MKLKYIEIDKEVLDGTPCFKGTRLPVEAILEYFFKGWTIDEIIEKYPSLEKFI